MVHRRRADDGLERRTGLRRQDHTRAESGVVRELHERSDLLEPGRIETYAIDLWATSNVFKAGHRLRLYVSSSNFPRFDRNPNTGEPAAAAAGTATAHQTVYHDAAHPSALVLPVVPRP